MTDSHCRTEEIYWRAIHLRSDSERGAYLAQACRTGAQRRRVERLLQANREAGGFLESPTPFRSDSRLKVGDQIDDYEILELLGEGGMGIVYRARQVRGVNREVALKVIKPCLDAKSFEVRFEIERQALARMNHPNIAKVLGAGTSSSGEPFFVMELIDGTPIDRFCVQESLTINERLELFLTICDAVEHAHRKGIIHRDLTPRNVLVTMQDGRPIAKVIDFGVAKSLDGPLTQSVTATRQGHWIGTPMYMSPEQIAGTGIDVDTRADVYALGALLYEITTDEPPFDKASLASASYEELRCTLLEKDPIRPSLRIQATGQGRSKLQSLTPDKPRSHHDWFPRDLDWIILKALDKARDRRYASASDLASDVRRFLNHEPIEARPPSFVYRLQKFVERRRTASIAALLVTLSVLCGAGVSVDQAIRARRAERLAMDRLETLKQTVVQERAARTEAEVERGRAEQAMQHNRLLHYLSDLKLAFQAWERRATSEMEQILAGHRQSDESSELRGPEWWLLHHLTQSPTPTVMQGHEGAVRDVVVLPGLPRCVSVGDDGTVRWWNLEDGTLQRTLTLGEGDLNVIAFVEQGRQFITGKHELILWDTDSGTKRRVLSKHPSTLESVAVSPDGRFIASGPRYEGVRIVNHAGESLTHFRTTIRNESLAFSPAGDFLYATLESDDGRQRLRRWSVETWERDADFESPVEGYGLFALSSDGNFAAASRTVGRRVHLHDLQNNRHVAVTPFQRTRLRDLAFSPHDRILAGAFDDGVLRYWTLRENWKTNASRDVFVGSVREIRAHEGKITSLEFVNERQILTCGQDGLLKLWTLDSVPGRLHFEMPTGVASLKYAPDGSELAVAQTNGSVSLRDVESGAEKRRIQFTDERLICVTYAPQGRSVAGGDAEGNIFVVSRDHSEVIAQFSHAAGKPVLDLAWSPRGNRLASIGHDAAARIWDTATWDCLTTLPLPSENGDCLAFSPSGDLLACGGYFDEVLLWNVDEGRVVHRLPGIASCGGMAFRHDGTMLATGHTDGSINLWNPATGERVGQLWSETPDVKSLGFSPDDRCLVSLSVGGVATVWHVASQQCLGVLHRDSRAPNALAFSPDGSQLGMTFNASDDDGGLLLLWRIR